MIEKKDIASDKWIQYNNHNIFVMIHTCNMEYQDRFTKIMQPCVLDNPAS